MIEKWLIYGFRIEMFRKDILIYIYECIQPKIRELNTILLKEDELKKLNFAIRLMINFSITLNRQFGREDLSHAFQPNFENLIWFKNMSKLIRVSEKMMLIMGSEYELVKIKSKFNENPYEVKKKEAKNEIKKIQENMLMPGMKRTKEIMEKTSQFKIIYKYKEGCISGIRRNLTLDFFFK